MKKTMKFSVKAVTFLLALILLFPQALALPVNAATRNYLLLDPNMEHGTVVVDNVNIEKVSVQDGFTVRLIPQPDEGYALKAFHVYYRHNNKEIAVEKYNNALEEYFFVIPKTNSTAKYILIGAEFEEAGQVAKRVSVYCPDNAEKGSHISIDRPDGMYRPGETVTVTVTKKDGSVIVRDGIFSSSYYDLKKQETIPFSDFPDFKQIDENTYTFSMPEYDVSLVCIFGADQATVHLEKYFVEEDKTGAEMTGEELAKYASSLHDPETWEYNLDWNQNMRWEWNDTYPKVRYTNALMRLETSCYEKDRYFVTDMNLVYYIAGEEVVENLVDWNDVGPNRELKATLKAPGVESTLLLSVDRVRRVNGEECEYGKIIPSLTRAIPGDIIKLTIEAEETWECIGISVKDSRGKELPLKDGVFFEMPNDDVTITGSWQKEYIRRQIKFTDPDNNSVWDLYYSDDYFKHPSTQYDAHLATLSIYMTKFSMNTGGPGNKENETWYRGQSDRVNAFFNKIGFNRFKANDDYYSRTGFDTIGIAAASKPMGDYTVIAVVPRSGGYFLEWGNNVWLGDGTKSNYMHEGWYNAAIKLIDFLKDYVKTYDITGKVKLWMTGFSRGGAVTNLAAGILDTRNEVGGIQLGNGATVFPEDLFAYTFEAPQGANIHSTGIEPPKSFIYNNIWNIINPNDLVPKVAMSQWGFTRFGQDKFITTKFFNPKNHNTDRISYGFIYGDTHGGISEEIDYIETYGISGEHYLTAMSGLGGMLYEGIASAVNGDINFIERDYTKENYDANIIETIILEELVRVIGTREDYVKNYQAGMSMLCMAVMSDDDGQKDDNMSMLIETFIFAGIGQAMGCVIPFGIVITQLVDEAFYTPDDNSVENILVHVAKEIFKERPTELVTFAKYIGTIFNNHGTDITLAHVQTQDFYYIDAHNDLHPSVYQVHRVNFLDNADMGRISFYSFNDVKVEKNGRTVVNLFGKTFGKSGISRCDDGYAVGYYSYAFSEKMELFFPVNTDLTIKTMSHSKQFVHEVSYKLYCQYYSLGYGPSWQVKHQLSEFYDTCSFDSDEIIFQVNVKP